MKISSIKLVLVCGGVFALATAAQGQVIGGKPRAGGSTAGTGATTADQEVSQSTNVSAAVSNDRRTKAEKGGAQTATNETATDNSAKKAKKTKKSEDTSSKKESGDAGATSETKQKESGDKKNKETNADEAEH